MIPPTIPPFVIWNFWKQFDDEDDKDDDTHHISSSYNFDYKNNDDNKKESVFYDKFAKIIVNGFLIVCFCCLIILLNQLREMIVDGYENDNFIFHGISRDKAKIELSNGKILRHKYFPSGVWVIQKNDSIYYNNGDVRSVKEFWKNRYPKLIMYNSGWAITDTLKYKSLINEKENDY